MMQCIFLNNYDNYDIDYNAYHCIIGLTSLLFLESFQNALSSVYIFLYMTDI